MDVSDLEIWMQKAKLTTYSVVNSSYRHLEHNVEYLEDLVLQKRVEQHRYDDFPENVLIKLCEIVD